MASGKVSSWSSSDNTSVFHNDGLGKLIRIGWDGRRASTTALFVIVGVPVPVTAAPAARRAAATTKPVIVVVFIVSFSVRVAVSYTILG
jgi:hypothetical protein